MPYVNQPRFDVHEGDFEQALAGLKDESVALILTDPPYAPAYLPLFATLSGFARRVLKPDGLLVAYSGNAYLPQVYAGLGEWLQYLWTLSLCYPDDFYLPFDKHSIRGRWKPLLVYGPPNPRSRWLEPIEDRIDGTGPEKNLHPWQQAEAEAAWVIERMTRPYELVVDPMCGSGTVGAAAIKLGRRFIGCDINSSWVATSRERLEEALSTWKAAQLCQRKRTWLAAAQRSLASSS